jgi:hypothetical protein
MGREFIIRLPIGNPSENVPESELSKVAATDDPHILIVDDNHDAVDMCVSPLELPGQHVHTAYFGRQALEFAHTLIPMLC